MASRKDVEAGRAHVLLYVKNQVQKGLRGLSVTLKQFAGQVKQVAEPLNQLSGIAGRAGGLLLGPLIGAVTQLKEAKAPIDDIKNALSEAFGRPMLPFLMTIRNIVVSFAEWAKQNPRIIQFVALIGAGLIGVAIAAKVVASGFMLIAGAATIASVASSALAAILSPAGLIIAGVVAIGAGILAATVAWLRFTESGKKAWSSLISFVKPFFDTIRSAFNGIIDAFSAGRLELAWQISVTAMKLLFFQMVQAVMDKFIDLVEFITDNDFVRFVLGDALAGVAAGARGAGNATIKKIKGDLDRLNRAAAAAAAKARIAGGGGVGPGEDKAGIRPSQVAQTTHEALALTFGGEPRNALGISKSQLEELKQIRKLSIEQHKEMITELRRGGVLRFTK